MSVWGKVLRSFVVYSPKPCAYGLISSRYHTLKLSTGHINFQKAFNFIEKPNNPYRKAHQRKTCTFSMNNNGGNISMMQPRRQNKSRQQFSVTKLTHENKYSRMCSTSARPFMEPKGKVAIITGGMRGIGLCMAEELLCLEAKVVLMDVDREVGESAVERLHRIYGSENSIFMKGDVTSCESFEDCFNCALCKYNRVDILVNNAGILQPQNWENTIKINFSGVVNGIHLGLKYMGANCGKQGGVIINLASILGHIPLGGAPVYTATKHGVLALTLGYADEFFYNKSCVRICAVCPGVTETSMIQVKNLNMDAQQRDLLACQLSSLPSQPPERLGPAVSHIVRHGANGSIWVSENNELYQVVQPKYQDLECSGTRIRKIGS